MIHHRSRAGNKGTGRREWASLHTPCPDLNLMIVP